MSFFTTGAFIIVSTWLMFAEEPSQAPDLITSSACCEGNFFLALFVISGLKMRKQDAIKRNGRKYRNMFLIPQRKYKFIVKWFFLFREVHFSIVIKLAEKHAMISPGVEKEFSFRTSRSRGAGGQNVNKVETKVELHFDILNTAFLSDMEKKILLEKLKNKINKEGILILSSESERTQQGNKKIVVKKFFHTLDNALKKQKRRIATKPTRTSAEKRLKKKKIRSEFKKLRRKDWD